MASIIRIKRSSTAGNPSTLGAGELAYSAYNGAGGNRLYIGMGVETTGNAANHLVIGGTYYTGLIDASVAGTLTTNQSSIPVLSATGTIDTWKVGNTQLTGNTLSSTDANGNINITPNGTGKLVLSNPYIGDTSTSLTEFIQDVTGGQIVDSAEIDATYDDTTGTTTLVLKTTGVTAGSYGSATSIPTFTVDNKGRLSAAGSVSVATNLSIAGDTGADTVSLLTDTLTFVGTDPIDTTVTDNTVTISARDATTTTKGVASFDTANFTVTNGVVSAKTITLGSTTLTLGSTTTGLTGLSSLGVTGNTTLSGTLGVTGAVTLSNTLGVAGDFAVNTNKFTVAATSGNTSVGGTLSVSGNTTLSGTLGVTGNTTLSGTLAVTNDLSVNTNKFNVSAATGNVSTAGTLSVTGATTLSSTLNVTGVATFGNVIDMNAHKITNLAEPTADSDAATKYYVDAARSGLDVKGSVRVATTGNITLSNTQTIDGVALSVGDRVLVKDQTTGSQNGIYVVASGTWARSADADNNPGGEVTSGMFCFVEEGTVNSDTGFVLTTNDPITLGTTALSFTLFSTSGTLIAGNGLSKNGYTLEVNVAGSGGIEIVSDNLQLKSSLAGGGLTYASGVLDVGGTANRITVNADSIDIASTYAGQTSIVTLGTITTGTWTGNVIDDAYISNTLTITGGSIDNTPIGATTRSSGAFTTLSATGAATLSSTLGVTGNVTLAANLTGAGAGTSTLDGFNIDGGTY